jgi:aminoglycoside phosphotransferase (APT) family kinase protein
MPRNLRSLATAVASYLDRPGSVGEVVPLAEGHSNESYLLRGLDMVLRTPPDGPGLLPPYDMRRQHDVLAEVRASAPGVPVPRVHGWCEDRSVLGAPFFLCELVPGESFEYVAPRWFLDATPDYRHRMCEQWIAALTALHRAPPLVSCGAAQTPEDTYRAWQARARGDAARGTASAEHGHAVVALVDRVLGRGLAVSGPATPVHGDPKLANTMWCDGRLTAVLDWEMAFNGEPLCDLGYLLGWFPADRADRRPNPLDVLPSYDYFRLPGMFSRDELIAAWEHGTGRVARDIEAFEAAEVVRTAAIVLRGAVAYESGEIRDERLAAWHQVVPLYLRRAEQLLADLPATAGDTAPTT